jgi:imidazole glycerol-phosphate synthase subunit HisH
MSESEGIPFSPIKVAVVDYGMGNLRSVCKALEHEGAQASVVTDPQALQAHDAVVFPGQGALGDCLSSMRANGMDSALKDWIAADRPYLGVCLGLQALFEHSEEANTDGLGIFGGRVRRFRLPPGYKIPHMGWNTVRFLQPDCPLVRGMKPDVERFYFVHSYYVEPEDRSLALCESDYGGSFVSGIARGRCFAVQFHPEKSQSRGLALYRNFLAAASANIRIID